MVETNRIKWNEITKMHDSEFNEQIQLARAGRPCLFFLPENKNKKSAQGQTATSHFGSALASAQALRDEQQQLHQQQQQQPQQPREARAEAVSARGGLPTLKLSLAEHLPYARVPARSGHSPYSTVDPLEAAAVVEGQGVGFDKNEFNKIELDRAFGAVCMRGTYARARNSSPPCINSSAACGGSGEPRSVSGDGTHYDKRGRRNIFTIEVRRIKRKMKRYYGRKRAKVGPCGLRTPSSLKI